MVRRELVDLGTGHRILYASDLHLRPGNHDIVLQQLSAVIESERPNCLLLGGDLVDHTLSLGYLTELVRLASTWGVVGAVGGNHDRLLGLEAVKQAVSLGGGSWLSDGAIVLGEVQVLGKPEQHHQGSLAILCSHYPTVFSKARIRQIPLTFAGHLHGWQIVLKHWGEYLYPGAFLSRWNGLRFERDNSVMLVSRGVTDLLPLRWNCPREVILAEL